MKWVIFISCLFLVNFAESKNLPRRYRDVADHGTIKRVSEIPEQEFAGIAFALYAQIAQHATLDEVKKLKDDIVALAKKCNADEHSDPECTKPLGTVFVDEICHEEAFAEKHGFHDCCAKTDPERKECIFSHKNASKGFVPPYQRPSVEEGCKEFHDHKLEVWTKYLYEIARRYPFVKIVSLFTATEEYDHVLTTCCAAAEKEACFFEKAAAVSAKLREEAAIQSENCFILKKFTDRALKAVYLALLSQRFPKSDLATLSHIAKDIVHINEERCKGDSLESLLDRADLTAYICEHKDSISSKIAPCCEKPLLERGECIAHVENDEQPADLTPTVREFIEDKDTCKKYAEHGDDHLAHFLFEYSRRKPEYSPQLLVRVAKGYGELLDKCCKQEHPEQCLPSGEEQLKKHVADTEDFVKKQCDVYKQLNDYLFQNELLIRYTQIAPQLSFEDLYSYSKEFTKVAAKCCKLDSAHQLPCAEKYANLVLGSICQTHEEHHINKQVCHCCGNSYVKRRECFSGLGLDPEYTAPPFDAHRFTFDSTLCSTNLELQNKKKQGVLVELIKQKPDISEEQRAHAIILFNALRTQCCEAGNHDECFATEGPKLIEQIRTDIGHH